MTGIQQFELKRGGSFNAPCDWAAFERLTRDLFARIFDNEHFDINGRNGKAQAGIDVWGKDTRSGKRSASNARADRLDIVQARP